MTSARVLSVNISPGGVPKLPVERAWIGEYGLDGDKHHDDTVHGGPLRAICLFGIEVIERLQAEGHPVEPGSVGENLTTTGPDWSLLPSGTRLQVGRDVLLELTLPAMPCETQRPNFIRGEFKRISPALFPGDSRVYARVLKQGEVRPGDAIEVLPPADGTDPEAWLRLVRVDQAELKADVRLWAAAAASGLDIHVSVTDELAMAAAPDAPEGAFNHALGLRTLPNLLPRVLDFYRDHGTAASFGIDRAPWAGAVPDFQLSVLAAAVGDQVADAPPPDDTPHGLVIRRAAPDDFATWTSLVATTFGSLGMDSGRWSALLPHLLATRSIHAVIAQLDGKPVGTGLISTHKRAAVLRTATVLPGARGHGIQRALIRERIHIAELEGCDLVAAHALAGGISEANLLACGLRSIGTRGVYTFDPAKDPSPILTERLYQRVTVP